MDKLDVTPSKRNLYDFPDMDAPRPAKAKEKVGFCKQHWVTMVLVIGIVTCSALIGIKMNSKVYGTGAIAAADEGGSPLKQTAATRLGDLASAVVNTPPSADKSIEEICDMSKLDSESGIDACVELCKPGVCCYAHMLDTDTVRETKAKITYDGESCLSTHATICLGYDVCKVLFDSFSTEIYELEDTEEEQEIPDAPDNLEEICSFEDLSACEAACDVAECCNPTSEDSCMHLYPSICSGYTYCDVLYVIPTLPTPQTLEEFCSYERMFEKDGKEDCESLCEDAACCFKYGNGSCKQKKQFCKVYEACAILSIISATERQKSNNDISNAIHNACTKDSIKGEEGRAMCERLCKIGECCLNEEVECASDISCESYNPCFILQDIPKNLTALWEY